MAGLQRLGSACLLAVLQFEFWAVMPSCGARCIISADPGMCQDDELGLCPSGPVEIMVELMDFQRRDSWARVVFFRVSSHFFPRSRTPDTWDLLPLQRIEKGRLLKKSGADFMNVKDFRRACWVHLGPWNGGAGSSKHHIKRRVNIMLSVERAYGPESRPPPRQSAMHFSAVAKCILFFFG